MTSTGLRQSTDISIVIPAYNERETIGPVIENVCRILSEVSNNYEIVVVDDGSNDGTREELSKIAAFRKNVKVVRHDKNRGKGAAVKSASKLVRGQSVIVIDSDGEISPRLLETYLRGLQKFDVCIASKRHPQSVYEAPPSRKFLSISFNKMVRLMTGVVLADTQTGLKAARGDHFTRIMNATSVKRFAYDVEFLAIAGLLKLRVAELPVHIHQTSKISPRAVMYMLIDLLGISYRLRIRKWYQQSLERELNYKPILDI